ncbi:hypothetical protein [Alteromonas abrolhosensis]|uniref:hypothetical protein n=1 Tax=Alteromonas abrolhosensis TaxID=1892904 RepID=UPI00096BB1EC|nr:hypothetical protein [Alteromonas abrolhosensis]|tara:strand:+ start:466 stop:1158 length:693 start_codon:yes stop_codon:yes gene_type:complete
MAITIRHTFFAFLLASSTVCAERVATPSNDFNEHFSSNVPVSGNILVGAMYSSALASTGFLLNTSHEVSHFCFKVSSIDGAYVSENDYELQADIEPSSQTVSLEYPTKFEDILSSFNQNQLAPLATTGSCEDQRYQHVLLSSRAEPQSGSDVLFMISSGRSEVFMQLKSNDGTRVKATCARIEDGKRTSFDTICSVPALSLVDEDYNVQIVRRKNGRSLPATQFTLLKNK